MENNITDIKNMIENINNTHYIFGFIVILTFSISTGYFILLDARVRYIIKNIVPPIYSENI